MESVIELNNVSKVYGRGRTAVRANDQVDLKVAPGEIVLIMGPSGSGKTTLLSMAGLLLSPTEGTIRLLGEDATRLSQRRMAEMRLRTLGFVFQSYNLMESLTARENVELVMNMAGQVGARARRPGGGPAEHAGLGRAAGP